MNFADIKFRNLEINGGFDPLPDGRNCHDIQPEDLRRELEHLGVPVSGLTKAAMIGRYAQCLEYVAGRPLHSETVLDAAKKLARRSA